MRLRPILEPLWHGGETHATPHFGQPFPHSDPRPRSFIAATALMLYGALEIVQLISETITIGVSSKGCESPGPGLH